MKKEERDKYLSLLKSVMMDHVGSNRKIGMGELYERIFGRRWANRINDTRDVRNLIEALQREEGLRICSDAGGYWLAASGSELEAYLERQRKRALKILAKEAKIRRVELPALLGQLALDFGGAA